MTCDWYEQQLASAVDLWPSRHPSAALLDHARTCSSCDLLVRRELELQRELIVLAQKNESLRPSPAVKRSLLAQFDSLHPSPAPRRMQIVYYAIAVAAITCIAIVLMIVRRQSTRPPTTLAHNPAVAPTTIIPKTAPTDALPTPAVVARHETPARRRLPVSPTGSDIDFYPVVMCDSVTCAGPALTVRVQLPRSPLATRGSSTPVMADLLVGEDGLVRGIRLLQ